MGHSGERKGSSQAETISYCLSILSLLMRGEERKSHTRLTSVHLQFDRTYRVWTCCVLPFSQGQTALKDLRLVCFPLRAPPLVVSADRMKEWGRDHAYLLAFPHALSICLLVWCLFSLPTCLIAFSPLVPFSFLPPPTFLSSLPLHFIPSVQFD